MFSVIYYPGIWGIFVNKPLHNILVYYGEKLICYFIYIMPGENTEKVDTNGEKDVQTGL